MRSMYTKQEASKQREAFWTAFGQYMRPVMSADGLKINWVNYKTGVPGIRFEMTADHTHAAIGVTLAHPDADIRLAHYEQLLSLKHVFEENIGEKWLWLPDDHDEYGRPLTRIKTMLTGVNIYRNEDWPRIITFFKTRLVALDDFWSMAKYGFELI